ncbi:WecB/TagA/CpsF family glycosyltransferase [uncultured Roseibium sp.]|uniref:WecB/TagA/CpsF family glycosyltransferase n=1 Tax=uncultured Roseibium sp. TaxID=1936171 RepID=UPI002610F4DE|nr:WecB/TagA/CpsF family glycosyltransferase [uncultured Roseibium sp.]
MNKVELGLQPWINTMEIGPLEISRLNRQEAIGLIRSAVLQGERLDVAICNAHTVLTAVDDPDFAATLNRMTLLNDGIGIDLASRFLCGSSFPDNLNGTDLVPDVLKGIGLSLRIYLLGAEETQLQEARKHIEETYPAHEVVGCRNGYFDMDDCRDICTDISALKPDLLLVAMGNPRQEKFIVQNRQNLDVKVAIGVGALFDFMSGSVARAPKLVRAAGLEWLFRLLQEPRRLFRRYVIGIPRFASAVFKFRFGG